MRLEYTKNLNDVLAKENEFLSDRRYKAAKEFGVATVNKKLQLTSEDGKLTPAQQAYKDTLAQPVVPRIRGAESRGAVGMAFSGGGIRSASFNFGLVQGLARYGVLPWVDYLSSVSGGGFTAGCLTSLLSYDRKDEKGRREYYHFNTQWDYFPFNPYVQAFNANGAAHSREATLEEINQNVGPPLAKGNNTQLVYLRNKSNYLIPRMGWFGSDSLRVIGSVFKTSYTVFIFLLVLFAISSFVYGLTTALIPYRLERFDIPMEQTYLEGKVESVIDTSKLLVLIFGSVDQVNFDGTSDISTGLYPTREYVLTLAFGFLISILIGVLFANFYIWDPTKRYKLRPWRSPKEGMTTEEYLMWFNLRCVSWVISLALLIATAWLWFSHFDLTALSSFSNTNYRWASTLVLFLFLLGIVGLVQRKLWNFDRVQGLDTSEYLDNLVVRMVAGTVLWGMLLWVAWLRFQSYETPVSEQSIWWIWLPTVFFVGFLLGLIFYNTLPLKKRIDIVNEGLRYEDTLASFRRRYYEWVLIPDEGYHERRRLEDIQARASTAASTEEEQGRVTSFSFIHSIWAGSGLRSIIESLLGLAVYGIVAFLGLALLSLPHYFELEFLSQKVVTARAISIATSLISVAWAALLASPSRSNDSAVGNLFRKIFSLPERLRQFILSLLVVILLLALVFIFQTLLAGQSALRAFLFAAIIAVLLALSGKWLDFNQLTPHYFFRDRIADLFLKTQVEEELGQHEDRVGIITVRDDRNDRLAWITPEDCSAPYHLIQTTLNLTGSRHLGLKDRKSQSFLLSKYYCGSEITGYVDNMRTYRGGTTHYAQAIALSGAAVSSGLGYHTFFAQAFLTTLLNIRLGLWMTNPLEYVEDKLAKDPKPHKRQAFWLSYLWDEASAQISERRAMVYLTDGEHCGDNIGLYPLFQRRCKFIIAGDAGKDSEGYCDSFFQVLRKVKMDFGIDVEINIKGLKPAKYDRENKEAEPSARHFAVGKIFYPTIQQQDGTEQDPAEQGWLIFFKPAVTGEDPASILNYWERRKLDFPHPSTVDQFFDEEQFEIQRHLGEWTVTHTLQNLLDYYKGKIAALEGETKARSRFKGESWKLEMRRGFVQKLLEQGEIDFETLFSDTSMFEDMLQALMEISEAKPAQEKS